MTSVLQCEMRDEKCQMQYPQPAMKESSSQDIGVRRQVLDVSSKSRIVKLVQDVEIAKSQLKAAPTEKSLASFL